jgi:hypothetical protein
MKDLTIFIIVALSCLILFVTLDVMQTYKNRASFVIDQVEDDIAIGTLKHSNGEYMTIMKVVIPMYQLEKESGMVHFYVDITDVYSQRIDAEIVTKQVISLKEYRGSN